MVCLLQSSGEWMMRLAPIALRRKSDPIGIQKLSELGTFSEKVIIKESSAFTVTAVRGDFTSDL